MGRRAIPIRGASAIVELGARIEAPAPDANLRTIVLAIHTAPLGRHGVMSTRAVVMNAAAFRDFHQAGGAL